MAPFYADLHLHSHYAYATSKYSDLFHLTLWGARKGLGVIGSGDFTHPQWRETLKTELDEGPDGLFIPNPALTTAVQLQLEGAMQGAPIPHYLLTVELSTIFKQDGQTRRVHHLVGVPHWQAADRLITQLTKWGNLASDGRPTLSCSARDLLEMVLHSDDQAFLIPAHIWTPWYAMLGSKSGFDSVSACYGDLSPHIFALETGLSSTPGLNRLLSQLDAYQLVSHSDAHSPNRLGREATLYGTPRSYTAMLQALKTGQGLLGTVEFIPDRGKYHLDGHRLCNFSSTPQQTQKLEGTCPKCHKPLTIGVCHRIHQLADRTEPADHTKPFWPSLSLLEILSQIEGVSTQSKRVNTRYAQALQELGPELPLLRDLAISEIQQKGWPELARAIEAVRLQHLVTNSGFDGTYGSVMINLSF
ncbi:endonuclease Q family protein [Magnetococcus sp. PR-3]|uniref:endonuclease Q family protein n=1 Tax=Magnetococcus sp. PR-3 TaxID=3120355 RepID=UPI002FCE1EAD